MSNFSTALLSLVLGSAAISGQSLEAVSINALAVPTSGDSGVVPVRLEPPPVKWHKTYQWSVVALSAGTAADMASSFKFSKDGQREANSVLRSGNGGYGMKGAALEGGLVGANLVLQHYLVKRHPGLRVPFTLTNYAIAGFQVFNVRHNLSY